MVGGVISDIYHADDRNTPMSLFAGSALFGTGLSPLISSVIQTRTSWRWIYYSHAIAAGIFTVIIYLFFEETRGSVLLSRKARALNKYYEEREKTGYFGVIMSMDEKGESRIVKRIRWIVKSDEERDSLAMMISISVYRPFRKFSISFDRWWI
jgi:MFS family permease